MKKLHLIAPMLLCAGMAGSAWAATTSTEYRQARNEADAQYKAATERCKNLNGNQKDVCMKDAKAQREKAKAEAKADYKSTPHARKEAREDSAEATYKANKERCDSLKGQDKDACQADAKAKYEHAKANAERVEANAKRSGDTRTSSR